MNFEKIYEGQTIKNYKELCELLGIKVSNSKQQKESQLERFSQKVDYDKIGHKFIVKSINDKEVIVKSGGIEPMLRKEICDLIVHNLRNGKDNRFGGTIIANKSTICNLVGLPFVDQLLKKSIINFNGDLLADGIISADEFSNSINSFSLGKLDSALKYLEKNNIITLEEKIIINWKDFKNETATDEQYKKIKEAERKLIDKHNKVSMFSFKQGKNSRVINEAVKEFLDDTFDSMINYYNVIHINLVTEAKYDIDGLYIKEKQREIIKSKSISKIISNVQSKIERAKVKVDNKMNSGFQNISSYDVTYKDLYHAKSSYYYDFKELAKILYGKENLAHETHSINK